MSVPSFMPPFVDTPMLPVSTREGLYLDPLKARELGARLANQYASADPFPHVVLDNFLPADLADAILTNFPTAAKSTDVIYKDRLFEHQKRQVLPEQCGDYSRRVFSFFNSSAILAFLEGLSGIDGLISDPYFEGGGFHEISKGGRLGIHADFRIQRKLRLNRRLNLLLYLNRNWQEAYGGHLEMWDRSMKRKIHSIAPLFNRCVIFNTDKDSFHGHPDPLCTPENLTRKSLALYYYTASEKVYEETPGHGTVFAARPEDSPYAKRTAMRLKLRTVFSWPELLPPILYRPLRAMKHRLVRSP